VIVRSPLASTKLTPRRLGPSRQATCKSNPRAVSRSALWRPMASRPRDVKKLTGWPVSRASCTATTAPPPAGSSKKVLAWEMLPAAGSVSTPMKLTHSMWPTTASRNGGSGGRELRGCSCIEGTGSDT
jgi:hypothetical protein